MKTVRLDDVCDIVMGQAPEGEAYNNDGVRLPLVAGAGDFGAVHPAPKKYTRVSPRACRPGDIILGVRASIGVRVLADREYCLGRGVAGLRARQALSDRYLWHWVAHMAPELTAKGRGGLSSR